MKKPFIVFGFLLTLFVSAIFGDYAISRGDFSPRAEASMAQKLQESFGDFLAGVSGAWAAQPTLSADANRSEVARVATASAPNEGPSSVASNAPSAHRAPVRDLSGVARSSASSSGLALGLGGDGVAGSFGAAGSGGGGGGGVASSGGNARGGSAAATDNADSSSGSGAVDAVGGGAGSGRTPSENPTGANPATRESASPSERNLTEVPNPAPSNTPGVSTPLDELFDNGGFEPIGQNPLNQVTEYLGAAPSQTGVNPSFLSDPGTDKAAAAGSPVQAAAVTVAQVPDVSGTIGLLVLPLLGMLLMRRRRA